MVEDELSLKITLSLEDVSSGVDMNQGRFINAKVRGDQLQILLRTQNNNAKMVVEMKDGKERCLNKRTREIGMRILKWYKSHSSCAERDSLIHL